MKILFEFEWDQRDKENKEFQRNQGYEDKKIVETMLDPEFESKKDINFNIGKSYKKKFKRYKFLNKIGYKKDPKSKSKQSKKLPNNGKFKFVEKAIKRGFVPDMIIVDYADKLKTNKASKEVRHDLENIYVDIRNLAEKYNTALWTCSQSNREGAKAELITMENISEAYSKVFPSDLIITLTRTKAEREDNLARFFIAKNRFGSDSNLFPSKFNAAKVDIKVLPEGSALLEQIEDQINTRQSKVAQKQLAKLRTSYNKMSSSATENSKGNK